MINSCPKAVCKYQKPMQIHILNKQKKWRGNWWQGSRKPRRPQGDWQYEQEGQQDADSAVSESPSGGHTISHLSELPLFSPFCWLTFCLQGYMGNTACPAHLCIISWLRAQQRLTGFCVPDWPRLFRFTPGNRHKLGWWNLGLVSRIPFLGWISFRSSF